MAAWPLVEVLHAFRAIRIDEALVAYRHDLLFWAITAPQAKTKIRQPVKPHILDD